MVPAREFRNVPIQLAVSFGAPTSSVGVAEGPMSKLFSTEAIVRGAEELTAVIGPDALRSRLDPTAVEHGSVEHLLRFSLGTTIYAGTSEIQRNIIARHRCRLPR